MLRKTVFETLASQSDWTKYTPGLDRVKAALRKLGNPNKSFKNVVVGGTNGKGTVTYNISDSLGPGTGLFQSPHLRDIRERITQNGTWIDDQLWEQAYKEIQCVAGSAFSFFEWLFLIACVVFRDLQCKWAVFEVGMGGRLDAVNALEPDVSILTSVSLDHMAYLGSTIASIAGEKVAICRKGKPFFLPIGLKKIVEVKTILEHIKPKVTWVPTTSSYGDNLLFVNEFRVLYDLPKTPFINPPGRREVLCNQIYLDTGHNLDAWLDIRKWLEDLGEKSYRVLFALSGERKPKDLINVFKKNAHSFYTMHQFLGQGVSEQEYLLAEVKIIDNIEHLLHQPLLVCGNHHAVGWVRDKLLSR